MRLTRPLAVVFAGALLISSALSTEVAAAPSKTKQIAAAFTKARTLYRQGKYKEAIRAFDEVKDLKYHPILDYGIANCYAALRDYNKGMYYLEKYIKNHSKHSMSPKHPTVADVRTKIGSWKKLAASAGTTPGPDPARPVTGTGTSGGTTPPNTGGTGTMAGDPLPGPDPYAVPPPPGGGTSGAVHGGGAGAGAPPPYGVRRRRGPARQSLVLSVDFGAAAFAAASGNQISDSTTGGGVYLTALWRIIPFFAIGVHGGASIMGADDLDYDYNPLVWAVGVLEARGYIPIGRLDIWAALGIGYGSISQTYYDSLSDYDSSFSFSGPALSVGVGVDWFFSRIFSLGVVGRIYKMFPTKACVSTAMFDACGNVDSGSNVGVSWYAGIAATYHFPMKLFGRRR